MIDAHCHIDAYPNPYLIAEAARQQRILVVAVTNTPEHYRDSLPHVRTFANLRPALGLHPLLATHTLEERQLFAQLLTSTSFVGEIGLDFSRDGNSTRTAQLESFQWICSLLREHPKFVSLHSRQAESEVLDILDSKQVKRCVFHWFTGALRDLDRAIRAGHLFSVNAQMLRSRKGRSTIDQIPLGQILSESDGPYARMLDRPCVPSDVKLVERHLCQLHDITVPELRTILKTNLLHAIPGR